MASLYKEIRIAAPASAIWDAARDLGALHTRLVPGFVTEHSDGLPFLVEELLAGLVTSGALVRTDGGWTAA